MAKYALLHWSDWSETDDEDVGQFEGVKVDDRNKRFFLHQRDAERRAIEVANETDRSVFIMELRGTVNVAHILETET